MLPEDIQNYILSFLPIVTLEKKELNSIIVNYNYYFIRELEYIFKYDFVIIYFYWLSIHPDVKLFIDQDNKLTLFQMRKLYQFAIHYGSLIKVQNLL